jgi:crotonobetainyl-CoA:carnitine CoA-transferase CaiB-like acyl-CoA transferase
MSSGESGEHDRHRLRVVECGSGVSASYATKLLADVGADVIKIEPPRGDLTRERGPFPGDRPDPDTSGLFVYLNTNKRGTVADLMTPAGQEHLATLLADADVLVHNVPLADRLACGLDSGELCRRFPRLVVTSISMFGDHGPRAHWRGYELTASNAGGWAYLSPGASPSPELPPLKPFGAQCDFHAAAYAAFTSLAAYRHQLRTGTGQAVDVSEQEAIAAMLEMNLMHWTYAGRETSRLGSRALGPWFITDCVDGKIFAVTAEEEQWHRLVELMGNPDWAGEEIFGDRLTRGQNLDVLKLLMDDWIGAWKVDELYREAQAHRIPFAPVNSMRQMYENEHLRDRKFFVDFDQPAIGHLRLPGAPSRYSTIQWSLRRPAPSIGMHTEEVTRDPWGHASRPSPVPSRGVQPSRRPLEDIRVLDLTQVWAGPFCTQNLAHLGAEVIRVETMARTPCITRMIPPFADDEPGPGRAGFYNQYNQGKRSIFLNLRKREAVQLAHDLVKQCDVVTDNFSAGVMDRLGLSYETLREIKPDIIQISMSGYGQTGPFRSFLGYGPPASALSGLFWLTGYPGGDPAEIGVSYPDANAGIMGAYAVLVALVHRDLTGEGQYIDQSQWEAVLAHMVEGLLEWDMHRREPARNGNHDRLMAPHETYKARGDDDKWVSIVVATDEEWHALCHAMGQPALATDTRFARAELRKINEAALDEIITAWTTSRDRWEVADTLQQAGVAAFPSMSNKDLAEDPHLTERDYLVQLEHPTVGRRIHAGIPWTMSATPCAVQHAAPLSGVDTDDIFQRILGLSPPEIDALRAAEIIY